MSTSWNHLRHIKNQIGHGKVLETKATYFPKNPTGTQKDLKKFSDYMTDERKRANVGRAWRAEELRLKSNDDLHKLWYTCLIEKNKLKSDQLVCIQMGQYFYGPDNYVKVRLTMSRLLTVVNERKKIRGEYRKHLENTYIAKKKAEEAEASRNQILEDREKGLKTA
jgi:large subunit ribosomal protein L47